MVKNNIGEALKRFRLEKRWTLQDVANTLGVHYHTIINWESGDVIPIDTNEYQIQKMFDTHGFDVKKI